MLGTLAVSRDGEELDLNRPLERRLLAVLLANRRRALSDDQIFHLLWPERLPEYPGQALRTSVSRLRKMLGDSDAIVRHGGGYRLEVEAGSVDADRFEALLADGGVDYRVARLGEALAQWTSNEAYADFRYHDFVQVEAARLQDLRLQACEELAEERLAQGASEQLIPNLQFLVREHPLRERLYGLLMLALYRAGRQAEALRTFQVARNYLGEELGLEPSGALVELEEQILLQDPRLDLAPRPAANNLPSRITSIVGRDSVIDALVGHLRERRLVTVTGPGGVGKTTVATEAARNIASEGRTECWHIDLGSVSGAGQVLPYLASELATLLQQPAAATGLPLPELIGRRSMLLVLDNCEHVIEEVADLVGAILKECLNAVVLATSRERIGLLGELAFPVEPLWAGAGEPDGLDAQRAADDYPALGLLVDRCEAVSPGFHLAPEEVSVALRLCRRLDGLPLAIELAAARSSSLSIAEIESQLNGYFLILSTQRGVGGRHRSLEAAIGWSYNLLTEQEQTCLQRLAQVHGPFTITDTARLLSDSDGVAAAATVALLRDKSLVRPTSAVSLGTQFELLQTIREFATVRAIEAGNEGEHRLRHAWCFHALGEEAAAHLSGGPHQVVWMTRCRQNTTDLLQAVETFIANDATEAAVDLVACVGRVWSEFTLRDEAYPIVRAALDASGDSVFETTPRAQVIASWLSVDAPGRLIGGGLEHAEEAVRTSRLVGDIESGIAATALLGLNQWLRGLRYEALESVREAYRVASSESGSWAETFACMIAGIIERALEPAGATPSALERAVASAQARSDEVGEAFANVFLGSSLLDFGGYIEAAAAFRKGYLSSRRAGISGPAIAGAAGLAIASWLSEKPEEALSASGWALAVLDGLATSAQYGALSQLYLAPVPTLTPSEVEEGMRRVGEQPVGGQGPAFIRFLLEAAEKRAVQHLDGAQAKEIRAGLSALSMRPQSLDPVTHR